MLSGACAGTTTLSGPFAHIVAPQVATFFTTSASGDKVSVHMALTRTVSAIWYNVFPLRFFDRDLWSTLEFLWEVNMVATGAFGTDMQLDVKALGRVQWCVNETSLQLHIQTVS